MILFPFGCSPSGNIVKAYPGFLTVGFIPQGGTKGGLRLMISFPFGEHGCGLHRLRKNPSALSF